MIKEVVIEYDFCDVILGKVRGLNSEEKQRIELWFRKRVDTILMQHPHAILDYYSVEYDILEKGVFTGYWANVEEAKKYVNGLLNSYVIRYKQVPRVTVRVNEPEAEYPPEYRIANMKAKGYSDEDISKMAKTLGLEENRVREIIQNRADIIAHFDMDAFCSELKKAKH